MRNLRTYQLFIVFTLTLILATPPLGAQEGQPFGARAGTISVLSDSSWSEAVRVAELLRGLERVAQSLALPTTDKPLTVLVLDNECDLARIDPALVAEVQSRRYFAEDEAFIVMRHSARHGEEVIASEYARFVLHEALWNPPDWFERGVARFFAEAALKKENGAALLASTCEPKFVPKLRRKAKASGHVDLSAPTVAVALIARFGLDGAFGQIEQMQTRVTDQSAWLGVALSQDCKRFSPAGEPLRVPSGTAEIQVRNRSDVLDRIASLQLRTREGSGSGIAYYRDELQKGRESAIVYREIGIGYGLRGESSAAIPYLEEAVRRSPTDFAANLYLGVQCSYDSACDVTAIELSIQTLTEHGSNPFVHYVLAQRALVENKRHAAEAAMKRAVSLRRSDPALHKSYAEVALLAGDLSGAEAEISNLAAWPDPAVRRSADELSRMLARQSDRLATTQTIASSVTSQPASD